MTRAVAPRKILWLWNDRQGGSSLAAAIYVPFLYREQASSGKLELATPTERGSEHESAIGVAQ
jgi:hypothetical protein